MKNFSLFLNVILLVAVGYLYVKVFSKKDETPAAVLPKAALESKIVFVNSDSLLDHYDLYNKMKKDFEHKRDSVDAMLKNKGRALKTEIGTTKDHVATI